ncbi:MAG: hypothetical protein SAK29_09620 [Scytonema sp. PMC 1069.18]|nr:hypothetical protein [Scytonema sp. PMC 1069.18]MEC4882572.1 hypothetical protein [Scytonema sp. PMC 1070.18]
MRNTSLKSFFVKTLIASTTVSTVTIVSVTTASAANCYFYSVNIQGTVNSNYGNQPFSVNQYAIWRDPGAKANQIDFFLTTSQDLNASAQVGQIELMTNSVGANNLGIRSAKLDLARVLVSNVVQFTLDSGISFQLPSPNVFVATGVGNSPGGLGGLGFLPGAGGELGKIINGAQILSVSYLIPRNGSGYFYSPTGDYRDIAGEIDIIGTAIDNTNLQGRYKAIFSGKYIKSQVCS